MNRKFGIAQLPLSYEWRISRWEFIIQDLTLLSFLCPLNRKFGIAQLPLSYEWRISRWEFTIQDLTLLSSMVVINCLDQLQPGTFEHAIHYLISNKLDLSIYFSAYNNEDTGRPAYDPAILLKIILFAYSKSIISSREIQWCCETNIIFKALSCDTVPHYTTIAGFISGHTQAVEALFEQILFTCDEQGLLGHELLPLMVVKCLPMRLKKSQARMALT